MKDIAYYILLFLTVLNTTLVFVASIAPFTSKDNERKRALTTISLSWLLKRQRTTLYLGLGCLVLWVLSPGLAPATFKLILCNVLTFGMIFLGVKRSKEELTSLCSKESIAIVRLELPEKNFLEVWVKKSKEEWPPLYLEIGMGPWFVDAELMSQSLRERMGESMRNMFPQTIDKLSLELRQCLNQAGATHPMDIRGAEVIPELKEFFERCLLSKV